jgi:hypothetical protein
MGSVRLRLGQPPHALQDLGARLLGKITRSPQPNSSKRVSYLCDHPRHIEGTPVENAETRLW